MKFFLKRLIEVYHPYRWKMLGVFGFIGISQILNLSAPYLQGRVIDELIHKRSIGDIYLLALLTLVMSLLQTVGIMYRRESYEVTNIDFSVPRHVHGLTLKRMLGFSIGQHISSNSGIKEGTISRGQHSLTALAHQVLYSVIPAAGDAILLIGALLYFSTTLGVLALFDGLVYASFVVFMNSRVSDDYEKLDSMQIRNSQLQAELLENIGTVQAHAQEDRAIRESDESVRKVADFGRTLALRFNRYAAIRNTILSLARFSILATGIFLVSRGDYTVGQLVMFLSWAGQALGQLGNVGGMHRQMVQLYTSVQSYFRMLAIEPDVKVVDNPVRPERFGGKIEFRNVTLSYSQFQNLQKDSQLRPNIQPTLKNVSFVIEPGETVAFVGESGSGKTSLVYALIRAQDPQEGQIVVDGHDLRVLDLKHFRERLGIVEQGVALFDHTLRYNLTYGLNGHSAAVTDAELDRIAQMACINRFFPDLEKGYDTIIGERGIKLSGGEKQRVGIGRALIKEPDIRIFDEATSQLDSKNESLIRESLESASHGRTTIIIAHRFSTIRRVKKVIVLHKGRVVGQGTHDELAETCQAYRDLREHQMM